MLDVLGAIDMGNIVERLISWIVIGLITGGITVAVMRSQMKALVSMVADLTTTVADHERQLADLRTDRTTCELRSSRTYATRAETARLISDQTNQYREIMTKLDDMSATLHGRINRVETGLAELRGEKGAA